MTVHVCRVDYSAETGSLVACTCGFALGPYREKANAIEAAEAHRKVHAARVAPTPEQKARHLKAQREKRAEMRRAKDPSKYPTRKGATS